MWIDDVVWKDALRITGARAVIVTAIETRTRLQMATVRDLPDGDSVTALAAGLAETAAELVRLTDSGSTMDDLVVTGPTWFHVLRTVRSQDAGGCVAHLMLDRRTANLAMARREFRHLLDPAARGPARERASATAKPAAGALPRRTPAAPGPAAVAAPHASPMWFTSLVGEPFEADRRTLRRVRDGLHRLA
ncbi:hypothetical protein [Phytohabitans rumicis]|uniref:Roadblock/LAMTOR2 domain-containing protein n=1 Tax=Phytohabitans rumicis TaxID=1076125 RepID=A0A6V8KUW8_9ACTN|nr:hypothetical protein [Phytohabitans rumicis]GFJ86508.1 hypothetical protein Prum_001500 [Phytohabitans rumicis]